MTRLSKLCDSVIRRHLKKLEDSIDSRYRDTALAILLSRVADDLRGASICASMGYVPQALTLAASIYELAYLASYVGRDEDRSKLWLGWPNYKAQPWRREDVVNDALRAAYETAGAPEVAAEEVFYSALCQVKHGNPRLQNEFAPLATGEAQILHADPQITPETQRRAMIAIWIAVRPIMISLIGLYRAGLLAPELANDLIRIRDEWEAQSDRIRSALNARRH